MKISNKMHVSSFYMLTIQIDLRVNLPLKSENAPSTLTYSTFDGQINFNTNISTIILGITKRFAQNYPTNKSESASLSFLPLPFFLAFHVNSCYSSFVH